MSERPHVSAWLESDPDGGETVLLENMAAQPEDRQKWLEIEVNARLLTSIMIRCSGGNPAAPDVIHLSETRLSPDGRSTEVQLVSGTSFAGSLRHRVERIVNTLGIDRRAIDQMFGPAHHATGRPGERSMLYAGRVWVEESAVDKASINVQSRVAIDRFTGAALETALYQEAAAWPKADRCAASFKVRLEIRDEPADQLYSALLLQGFKDLWLGDLNLGGEGGIGRGVFQGQRACFRRTGFPDVLVEATDGMETADTVCVTGWDDQWQSMIDTLRTEAKQTK